MTPSVWHAKCVRRMVQLSSAAFPPKDPYRNHWTARKPVIFPGVRQFYTTGCWHPGAMEVLRLGLERPSCLPTEVPGLPIIVCNATIARYAVAQRSRSGSSEFWEFPVQVRLPKGIDVIKSVVSNHALKRP